MQKTGLRRLSKQREIHETDKTQASVSRTGPWMHHEPRACGRLWRTLDPKVFRPQPRSSPGTMTSLVSLSRQEVCWHSDLEPFLFTYLLCRQRQRKDTKPWQTSPSLQSKGQISYTDTDVASKETVLTVLREGQPRTHRHKSRLLDTVGGGEGGAIRGNSLETDAPSCVEQPASGSVRSGEGNPEPVPWQPVPRGRAGLAREGRGSGGRGHVSACGRFTLMYCHFPPININKYIFFKGQKTLENFPLDYSNCWFKKINYLCISRHLGHFQELLHPTVQRGLASDQTRCFI